MHPLNPKASKREEEEQAPVGGHFGFQASDVVGALQLGKDILPSGLYTQAGETRPRIVNLSSHCTHEYNLLQLP